MAKPEDRSRTLSYLLRHRPEKVNLHLDKQGWCAVEQLIANTDFTANELEVIVEQDEKGRYSFNDNRKKIRANQGHSSSMVEINFPKAVPPAILYHATTEAATPLILKQGLKPMRRQHVHLTASLELAKARRRSGNIILVVDAKRALAEGISFMLSTNSVWLVNSLPARYFSVKHNV